MPDFKYEALSQAGMRISGTITADTERAAMMLVDSRGLMPLKVTPIPPRTQRIFGGKVKGRHMATFFSQLADLLRSGVPLLRSLELLEQQSSNPTLSEVVRETRLKVADGTPLSDAMKAYPGVFSELAVSMVRAGQEGGFLEDVLKRIADFTEHQEDLKAKVIGAMAYPVFLAVVGVIVLNLLVIFFVPKFEQVFKKLRDQGELPALTEGLMSFSALMQGYWWAGILLAFFTWQAFTNWRRSPAGRMVFDRLKIKIPLAGPIFLNLALARFTRILGTLLKNGIPLLPALTIAKDSTGNKVLAKAIEESAENITAGNTLAAPLRACPYFPKDVVEMVAIAEESNSLDTVLVDIAISLEKRTARQLELFVKLLEPIMLLVMAGVTLLVVAGLLLPVFKMGSTVK